MADKRLSILLTVPGDTTPRAHQIDVDYAELRDVINRFAAGVKDREVSRPDVEFDGKIWTGIWHNAHYLYDKLIRPMEAHLKKANAQVLMISATDVLRLVPFAALVCPAWA